MSVSDLKKRLGNIENLSETIDKMKKSPEYQDDERYWKPTVDKAGNGSAVIRFLPASELDPAEHPPWTRIWSHSFQGPTGKWYINNSLTTLKEADPVSEYNTELWAKSNGDDDSIYRKQAREQKRRLSYVSNILVISDPMNRENEGKVFLYAYGSKIFQKIEEANRPPFDDEGNAIGSDGYKPTNAFNPFNPYTGADFRLRISKVKGYRNYDQSSFAPPAPISKDDKKIEEIWSRTHSLVEVTDRKNFKTYDELKARLELVLGSSVNAETPRAKSSSLKERAKQSVKEIEEDDDESPFSDDDDELSKFRSLA